MGVSTETAEGGVGPLAGLRIIELGHFIAAPFATRVLADLGADVIKVEPPGEGDPVRRWGKQVEGGSVWWSLHGRNKRCVTVNLKAAKGRALIRDLVRRADIVVENYRPGQLEKFGLGPDVLGAERPGLVIVRISGFGQTGPRAGMAGFGVIGEAKGGLRYLCAHHSDVSDLPPVRTGISIGDSIAGLYGALGALAAVIEQRANGAKEPRVIDVALGESVLSLLEGILPEYSYDGSIRQPAGSRIETASPSSAYRSADGQWVLIAANSERLFEDLCSLMNRRDLIDDARFKDNPSRVANNAAIDEIIGAWAGQHAADQLVDMLEQLNIPTSKVYSVADIADDAQYRARDMIAEVDDPRLGRVLHPGVVPVIEGIERSALIRWPGPHVGAHNRDVFGGLAGLSEADIATLEQEGVI
ncbi:MAG: CaiB/BaiF CoA transferase family protein [Hyphomicrobiaceae bacterium]